ELGDGRERAGAADLDLDCFDDRGRLLGRELVRDRPARGARYEAEPLLPVDALELVVDTVDVVVELGALGLDIAMERQQGLDRPADLHQRIGGKAAAREAFEHAGLSIGRHFAYLAPPAGKKAA